MQKTSDLKKQTEQHAVDLAFKMLLEQYRGRVRVLIHDDDAVYEEVGVLLPTDRERDTFSIIRSVPVYDPNGYPHSFSCKLRTSGVHQVLIKAGEFGNTPDVTIVYNLYYRAK